MAIGIPDTGAAFWTGDFMVFPASPAEQGSYVAEDNVTLYVAEDGVTDYVTEG